LSEGQLAWLVGAIFKPGQVTLRLVDSSNQEPVEWTDRSYPPYYLSKHENGVPVKKIDLFTGNEVELRKVIFSGKLAKNTAGWELDIDPAMSYVYDNGLRFGVLHRFTGKSWSPYTANLKLDSRFDELFGNVRKRDPLKYEALKEFYSYISQPVPKIPTEKLSIHESGSDEDYYNAFLLSRIANLPLNRTFRNYSVSDWIRSMLNTYYRGNNILIPNPQELMLGDTRKQVTGALAIGPEPGTYFNMHVLDYESLYPGCVDVFNLSYETIQCQHAECRSNTVPGQPQLHVCKKRRGIYSALVGAIRDLRLQIYKPQTKKADASENALAASRILKLFLVSCYGVTIRIHGLASPLLGEAITAYGRYVLQSTWDLAKKMELRPKYSDTDSLFLDNPPEEETWKLIQEVGSKFRLQLAHDRVYSVCVLSTIKAYFGILPTGEPEIKGLAIAKSNSPRFFQETFQQCLIHLAQGRHSPSDFEMIAKKQLPEIVNEAVNRLRQRRVSLTDLEYRVELREEPAEKLQSKRLAQPYQAAWLLDKQGNRPERGETIGFVKVLPFRLQGRQFTVKPTDQANPNEIDVDDYALSLFASLSQVFDPMNIKLKMKAANLSDFVSQASND